jgi:hypothetical protein
MISWLFRRMRRESAAPYDPPDPPDTPATIKAERASEQLEAVNQRILRALQERDDGGFLEHALWPDLPAYPHQRREQER